MVRTASPETQLRNSQRDVRVLRAQLLATETERNTWRRRAEKAESELTEWKVRFDKLLERTPKDQA